MEDRNETSQPKRKWKKKKSLLATARKYGKKEWWGRGANISEDMYHYLVGILEVMKNGSISEEEKKNLVDNVLEKTIGEEIKLSSNQLGCRIIEELLPLSKPSDLERFIDCFSSEMRVLCTDKYASFVLEQLLTVCCYRAIEKCDAEKNCNEPQTKKRKVDNEYPQDNKYTEHIKICFDFVIKVSKYLLNNLEDFVWDPAANRILRTSIKCLGGIESAPCEKPKQVLFKTSNEDNNSKPDNKRITDLVYRVVPDEFKNIIEEHANRLSRWPQFTDMPYETITSGLLQMLIFALGNVNKKLAKTIAKKLLNESFVPDSWMNNLYDEKKDNENIDIKDDEKKNSDNIDIKDENKNIETNSGLPPVFDSEPAVRLLEAVLYVARSKIYTQIYAKCFINRLAILSSMSGLNFTVQRLFDNCSVKEEFESMFDEIAEKFNKILFSGNTGVLAAIAKACLRLQSKQIKFIQAMEQALECSESDRHRHFVVLCARLLPFSRVNNEKHHESYFVNIHGSVILQTMLMFQRPKKVIDSLLLMDSKELSTLFIDAKGSHIADSFYEGSCVGAKSKELLVKRLKGTYQELAVSKYGSRALEKMFYKSNMDMKVAIMEELSHKGQLLNSTMFGQVISSNLKIDLYKKSFQRWKSSFDKVEKVKEAFKDITK